MIQKCKNKESIRLCLQNKSTTSDNIEILPGLNASVIIHGHPNSNGRKYLPTIVTLNCKELSDYASGKIFNQENKTNAIQTKSG